MDNADFIIAELVAVEPGGTRLAFAIRVGKPLRDNRCYACAVQFISIFDEVRRIYGGDSMQAMVLALEFVKFHLKMAENRGVRFFEPDADINGESFDWRQIWFGENQSPME